MLESFDGMAPRVAASAFIHSTALVRGDVEIGELCVICPGAVINGDWGTIRIGKCTIIEENCVLHAATRSDIEHGKRTPMEIGDHVTVGHGAVVHGRSIGSFTMIGMNATVLDQVEIGDRCVIAAGAVLREAMHVPSGSFVAGVPAVIKSELRPDQRVWVGGGIEAADSYFAEYISKLKNASSQAKWG